MGTSTERLRDPVAGHSGEQMMERSGNVRKTAVIHVLQILLRNILNLLRVWQVTQDFMVNCGSEKPNEQNSDYEKNLSRSDTWWVPEDIIKNWLEGLR